MTTLARYAAALAALLCVPCAHAELPPHAYESMANAATEVLCLNVETVARSGTKIEVAATVDRVVRSQSDLTAGERITFAYEKKVIPDNRPGPSEPPLLKEGTTVPAYLERDKATGQRTIAAGGWSFRAIVKSDWETPCAARS